MSFTSLFLAGKVQGLTSYFSITFLVLFFPLCILLYAVMPQKAKKYYLLTVSCGFFWLISGKLIVYLFLSILSFSDIYVPPWSAWLYSVLYYYTTNFRFFQVLSIINSMNNPLQADCGFIKSRARFAEPSVGSSVFFRSDSVFSRP